MIKMEFKLKKLIGLIFISSTLLTNQAFADMSYGGKFFTTTLSACVAGGVGANIYAASSGYDSQPKEIMTYMGATTGCLTGALFSYLFFDDNSSRLETKISEQQKTIQDLSLQLGQIQGEKQNSTKSNSLPSIEDLSIFDNLDVKEGKIKSEFDTSLLPKGLNLKNCTRIWEYTLAKDGSDIENVKNSSPRIITVSKNFALVGFTFFYSPNDCFSPSTEDGKYAENYFPGITNFLKRRVINYNVKNE